MNKSTPIYTLHQAARLSAWVLFVLVVLVIVVVLPHSPEVIAGHYDANGQINQWGSRWFVCYPLGVCAGLFALLELALWGIWRVKMPKRMSAKGATLCRWLATLWCDLFRLTWLSYFALWAYCDVTLSAMPTTLLSVGIWILYGSLGALVVAVLAMYVAEMIRAKANHLQ